MAERWTHLTVPFIVLNILCAVIGLATIFLNLFVVCTICAKSRLWNITLTFLINLAVADTLTGVFVIYNVIYNCLDYDVFMECAFRSGCVCGIMGSSAMIIVGLGFERYVKIVAPLRYMTIINSTTVKRYLTIVWLTATIIAFSPLLLWACQPISVTYCDFFTVLQEQYLIIVCSILCMLLTFMCFMYGHILLIASSKTRSEEAWVLRPRLDSTNQKLVSSSKWWKPTKVVLVIVGVNFLTLLPIGIYIMVVLSGHMDHVGYKETGTIVAYVAAPAYLNSLVNPILYAFKIPYIRATFNQKFSCKSNSSQTIQTCPSRRRSSAMTTMV